MSQQSWFPRNTKSSRSYRHCAVCRRRYAPADDEYTENDDVTCLPRCRGDVTFRADDKRFAATWQIVWASLSLTSSLITVLTVIIDSTRFRYPERPVVFVAICTCDIIPLIICPIDARCTTCNVVDCLRRQSTTLQVVHRHRKLAPESGVEVMATFSGACVRGLSVQLYPVRHL